MNKKQIKEISQKVSDNALEKRKEIYIIEKKERKHLGRLRWR